MNRFITSLLLYCAIAVEAIPTTWGATIAVDTVLVGNPGNPADPTDGDSLRVGIQNLGAVPYTYRMGTTEVTNDQYVAFLNAKAKSDPLRLYHSGMNGNIAGGITRSGTSDNYSYASKPNMGNKPVNFVNWYDALRFCNWLHNGQGTGDTEVGAYTLGKLDSEGIPFNGDLIRRSSSARWFLPNEDEWYKAAYHQPATLGGDSDDYWAYPTARNGVPTIATANPVGDISNPGDNVANYTYGARWNDTQGNVTTVGSAGPFSASFYGTYDQGGNVYEWTEPLFIDPQNFTLFRGLRGGSFANSEASLQSSVRGRGFPAFDSFAHGGFRVAAIPEPPSLALCLFALAAAVVWRRSGR